MKRKIIITTMFIYMALVAFVMVSNKINIFADGNNRGNIPIVDESFILANEYKDGEYSLKGKYQTEIYNIPAKSFLIVFMLTTEEVTINDFSYTSISYELTEEPDNGTMALYASGPFNENADEDRYNYTFIMSTEELQMLMNYELLSDSVGKFLKQITPDMALNSYVYIACVYMENPVDTFVIEQPYEGLVDPLIGIVTAIDRPPVIESTTGSFEFNMGYQEFCKTEIISKQIYGTDEIDGDIELVITRNELLNNENKIGQYIMTFEATDIVGNKTIQDVTINVIDETPPIIIGDGYIINVQSSIKINQNYLVDIINYYSELRVTINIID